MTEAAQKRRFNANSLNEEQYENEDVSHKTAGVLIDIDDIEPSEKQHRSKENALEDDGLSNSIKENGVLQNLIVIENQEKPGKYIIKAGERRWHAARKAGLTELPCKIIKGGELECYKAMWEENHRRKALNLKEEIEAVFEADKLSKETDDIFAHDIMSESKSWVSTRRTIGTSNVPGMMMLAKKERDARKLYELNSLYLVDENAAIKCAEVLADNGRLGREKIIELRKEAEAAKQKLEECSEESNSSTADTAGSNKEPEREGGASNEGEVRQEQGTGTEEHKESSKDAENDVSNAIQSTKDINSLGFDLKEGDVLVEVLDGGDLCHMIFPRDLTDEPQTVYVRKDGKRQLKMLLDLDFKSAQKF